MTAGERSDHGYGHDEQTFPPYHAHPPHDAGFARSVPDGQTPEWYGQPESYPQSYPDSHQAAAYQAAAPWSTDDPWGGPPTSGVPAGSPHPGSVGVGRHSTSPPDDLDARGRVRRRGLPLWQELPLLLVIAVCLAILVRTFLLQAFYIPSGSMEDTLIAGDRVLVNKVVYQFREPARGEVVVFQGTDAWAPIGVEDEDIGTLAKVGRAVGDLVGVSRPGAKDYIKRVIGLPGDTVSCCDVEGRVFVNGQPLDESYVIRNSPLDDVPPGDCRGRRFDEVVVRPGHMFVMGDHRQVSQDSRCQGQVPIENVIGRAFAVVWPSDRWGGLGQPDIFSGLAPPAQAHATDAQAGGEQAAGAQAVLMLPLLLSLGATLRGKSPDSVITTRRRSRRLA